MESFRDFVPDVQINEEGEVAFGEFVLEFGNGGALGGAGEGDEIEVGVGVGGEFHTGAVGPDSDVGEVAAQEREQHFPLLCGDVDVFVHSQIVPVIVW